ncbi:hypothetical protein V8E53_005958 [Lactarius tabidus]
MIKKPHAEVMESEVIKVAAGKHALSPKEGSTTVEELGARALSGIQKPVKQAKAGGSAKAAPVLELMTEEEDEGMGNIPSSITCTQAHTESSSFESEDNELVVQPTQTNKMSQKMAFETLPPNIPNINRVHIHVPSTLKFPLWDYKNWHGEHFHVLSHKLCSQVFHTQVSSSQTSSVNWSPKRDRQATRVRGCDHHEGQPSEVCAFASVVLGQREKVRNEERGQLVRNKECSQLVSGLATWQAATEAESSQNKPNQMGIEPGLSYIWLHISRLWLLAKPGLAISLCNTRDISKMTTYWEYWH